MEHEQIEEIKRHFGVIADALRADWCQLAEGHSSIRHEVQEFRNEVRDEFRKVRSVLQRVVGT